MYRCLNIVSIIHESDSFDPSRRLLAMISRILRDEASNEDVTMPQTRQKQTTSKGTRQM